MPNMTDSPLVEVVGCVLVAGDNHILLGRRADNGLWADPGGKVNPGESLGRAAIRELLEETGIKVAIEFMPRHIGSHSYGGFNVHFMLVKGWMGFPRRMEPEKCLEWRWFRLSRTPAPSKCTPGTARLLMDLPAFLAGEREKVCG
jgi:8-oxo-dGTP diphosphatase